MDSKWKLHIISNTHWDREWYMSFEKYRWRLVKLMDRLLHLLETKPEFKSFTLDGQFLAVRDYLDIRPEKEQQVRRFVKEGRLMIGPWYTQPMETLASGEALIRNLMLGIRESKEFGRVLGISYIIDEFSHISQLPQILNGFGIKDAVAWRGIPKDSKSVFKWIGSDGSEVYVFYSNGGYGEATALPPSLEDYDETLDDTSFQRPGLRNRIDRILKRRLPKATTGNLLLLNGIDHSFAQEDLPEVINQINENFDDVYAFHSDFDTYAATVKQAHLESGIEYRQHKGEMMDSYESPILQDAHSTRMQVKLWNSRVQDLLEKWAEPFAAIAWLFGMPYPKAQLWKAWDYVLQNHAHDSINCSSSDEVYHQVLARFESADDIGEEIAKESLQALCNMITEPYVKKGKEKGLVVFNPLNWERDEVITAVLDIPLGLDMNHFAIMDGDNVVPGVIHSSESVKPIRYDPYRGHPTNIPVKRCVVSFAGGKIPASGYKAFKLVKRETPSKLNGCMITGHNTMENEYIRIEFNSNGTFNLLDKQTGRLYGGMHLFEDSGEAGDGFARIQPDKDRVIYSTGANASISFIEKTPLKSTFKIDLSLMIPATLSCDRSSRSMESCECIISSLITLTAGSPRVDIKTTVENKAKNHRLRVMFPTGIQTVISQASQPFDVVKRSIPLPSYEGTPVEPPRSTHPQQHFVDISDGAAGIMIANKGLYEYEVTDDKERSIGITLLRCMGTIYGNGIGSAGEWLMPEAQCLGEYTFEYSLIPHRGEWQKAWKNAYEFAVPLRAVLQRELEEEAMPWFKGCGLNMGMLRQQSFIQVEPDGLIVSAVKKHETNDSIILRLLNLQDKAVGGRIRQNIPGVEYPSAYEASLDEKRQKPMELDKDGWLSVHVRPKGLLTVELVREQKWKEEES